MAGAASREPLNERRRTRPHELAQDLDRSADDLLHLRDRIPLLALIRALLHAFRSGEREVHLPAVR